MHCSDCPRFNEEKRTCRDGKINPEAWAMAVEASNVFGVRSICIFNDHRERLVESRLNVNSSPDCSDTKAEQA